MNTFQFYLTEMGFVSLILIILSLVFTIYLLRVKTKSRSSWLLIGFFFTVIANSLTMLIANGWFFWGDMLMPAQDAWILLGGVLLGQFAYYFPNYDQKREARVVLVITVIAALFAIGYSIFYAVQYIFYYTPGLEESDAYYLLLPLMTLFVVGVFLRRSAHYAIIPTEAQENWLLRLRQSLARIIQPQNREVRMLRDFGLALSLGLLPGIAYFLKPLSLIPDWLPSYMLSIGSVLAVSALALVYLNNSGEQTSFIGKIMGTSLVTFLLLFGAFGLSIIQQAKNSYGKAEILQVAIAHRSILSNEFKLFPARIIYIVSWEQNELTSESLEISGHSQNETNRLLYLRSEEDGFSYQKLENENQIVKSQLYHDFSPLYNLSDHELLKLTDSAWQLIARFAGYPYGSKLSYYGYLFIHNNSVYEIGLSQTDKLNNIHQLVISLTSWVVLSSLIIIVMFPVFYRFNLVQPLNNLLAGVKRANHGDLDIYIPIQYEDEIGYLTRSINRLLSSLYKSNQARDELDAELEQRIEELLLSEEKFSTAFHSSPVSMVLQNQDSRTYLDVNEAFTKVTGYSRYEAIGFQPGELSLYPTQEEANRVGHALIAANGRLRNFEFVFLRKSGEIGTGLLSSETFELHGVRTILGIVMDITERKQAEVQINRLNLEMEKRVVDRSRELSTFLDLAFLASRQESPNQIYKPTLERILEISRFQAVCIHVYSDRQYLTLHAQVGLEEFEVDQVSTLIPTDNFSSWLAQPTDPLLLSDLQSDVILPAPLRALRFGSCLVAQLVAQGEVLGVMSCYHQDMHTFSLEEISLLVAVAEQLGISLENYRLRLQAEQVAVSTERRRLARDLHDSITQSIYSLTLFTRSSQDALNEGDQEKLITNLEQIEENAVLALKEMRLLLYQMQPQGREGGFAERIEARLDLVERRSGIQATCQINEQISLSPEKQDMLFHIALEALNNSLKHANANRVHISLEKKDGILLMEVADNGHGFDFKDQSDTLNFSGLGLRNMYARADELNGQLDIVSSPNDGTRVCFSIDLRSVQI